MNDPRISRILEFTSRDAERIEAIKELVISNAVMAGEIPAPTFGEEGRVRFIQDRFTESDLENISVDEAGNVAAMIPGKGQRQDRRRILLSANLDTVFPAEVDHAMSLGSDRITGPGICDNSLGLGTLISIPQLLQHLDITLDADLILLGSAKSLGHGDLAGIRFFLENYPHPIDACICIRGVQQGRLSYASLGMLRGEIQVDVDEEYDWKHLGDAGAISILNRVITRLQGIPLPTQPATSIVLGSVRSGNSFSTAAASALLRFEVRSEEEGKAEQLERDIQDIVDELAAENEVDVILRVIARRQRGGISFSHPLVRTIRAIQENLGIEPIIAPSTGELCALIDRRIPAVTVGLSTGEHIHEPNETVLIPPLFRGITQVTALLRAIDGGICDE